MVLTLFSRNRAASSEPLTPGPWPEIGETWMPAGVTVVERYWNEANAVVLVYSADDTCYHHVVACLGCHFLADREPERSRETRLKLNDAARVANEHAHDCRALSRDLPARPDDDTAREQLRTWALSRQSQDKDVEIRLDFFDSFRLMLQRSNEWIVAELQRLAADRPDTFAVRRGEHGAHTTSFYYVLSPRGQ